MSFLLFRKRAAPWCLGLLLWGLGFWLAGYYFFESGWLHLRAFWVLVALPFLLVVLCSWKSWLGCLLENRVLQILIAGMVFYSVRTGEWLEGGRMLIFLNALALTGRERWKQTGNWLVGVFLVGSVTMGWSLWEFYLSEGRGVFELRFKNTLVYTDGLNPVLTGMLCGLAIVCGLALKLRGGSYLVRFGLSVLMFALLASRSRGALLATVCGLAIWFLWKRKEAWREMVALLGGGLAFGIAAFLSPPMAKGMGMMERGGSGRREIYETYLSQLSGVDWLWGKGSLEMLDASVLGWLVHHPHCVYLTQLWQTGLLGLVLLLAAVGLAVWKGASLWKESVLSRAWLMWLVFGMAALLFDGGQVFVLNSLPRLEPFLLLVPAVILGAQAKRF